MTALPAVRNINYTSGRPRRQPAKGPKTGGSEPLTEPLPPHFQAAATIRRTMTVSAVPPRIRRGIGWMWMITCVVALIVAIVGAILA